MLTLAVAASAFAACNKQETTPVVDNQLGNKSIVLSIANVVTPTKAAGTEATIANGTQVTLNNYQIFFADGNGKFYAPKDATASDPATNPVQTYFTVTSDGTDQDFTHQDFTHQFHFLDNNVTRVIVVGNKGADFAPANEDALWEELANVKIEDQQEASSLILYGSDSDLKATAPDHYITPDAAEGVTGTDQHPSPVYQAEVNLMPAVARFEIVGYEYAQKAPATGETEAPAREYASVAVNSQSLIGFYENAALVSEDEDDWQVDVANMHELGTDENGAIVYYNWDNVYQNYFGALTNTDKAAWYYDAMTDVTLNATGEYKKMLATQPKDATATTPYNGNAYAYHVFPTAVPSFMFQLTALDAANIETLMYLQTKSLSGASSLQAGKIYQMVVKFDDTVLKAAEKCIDVKITVHDWQVVVVTPQF